MLAGGAGGQNLVHLQNMVFQSYKFLEVHILTTTYLKAFILGPWVPDRVGFHSMTSDSLQGPCPGNGLEVII